jgi:hypothetical protein
VRCGREERREVKQKFSENVAPEFRSMSEHVKVMLVPYN